MAHSTETEMYVPRRGPPVYLAAIFGGVTVEAFVPAVQINILFGWTGGAHFAIKNLVTYPNGHSASPFMKYLQSLVA